MNFLKVKFQFWIGVVSQILYTWQIVTARGTSLIEIIRAYVAYVIDIYEASFELDVIKTWIKSTFDSSFNVVKNEFLNWPLWNFE